MVWDLLFVEFFFFPCKTRWMMQIYNYCLSDDLKYMDIDQENKIFWISYQHLYLYKLFVQYLKTLKERLPWKQY